jgi:putative ABC transport system permease protein
MLRYLPMMFKNAVRNRRRSALTIVSIGASLCLLGVLFALYRGMFLAPPQPGQELRLIVHHKVSFTQPVPISYEDKIRRVPGVQGVTIWQWFGGTYKDARDRKNFFARFVVEPERFFEVRPELNIPEEQKQAFIHQRTGAIASADLAERMNWKLGEKIFLTGDASPVNPELILVGIFKDATTTETMFFSYSYLKEMMRLKDGSDMAGAFQVQVDRAEDVPTVSKAIDDMFVNSTASTKTESEQAFGLQFLSFLGNVKVFLMSICAAVTFTVLLVSANTMAMSVRERVREVGILKTLGFTNGSILFMVLGEAGIISLIGGGVGLLLAILLTGAVRNGPSFVQTMKTLSITPDVGALLIGIAFVIGVASSFVPAYNASRTPILDALNNTV